MTVIKKVNFVSSNKKIRSVLIDNSYINIVLLNNNKIFRYYMDGKYYKVVVIHFKHTDRMVSQAFYQCVNEYKGTWLPFDGIKGDVDEDGRFYKYIDTKAFANDHPFGDNKLMAVSYILGNGVWMDKDSRFKKILNVDDRSSLTMYSDMTDVNFEDSLTINHYINYSISRNYYENNPEEKLRPSSPQWIKDSKKNINDQKLFSAFDFSTKMNNTYQLEYTPTVIPKFNDRSDYEEYYKKVDKSKLIVIKTTPSCNIL